MALTFHMTADNHALDIKRKHGRVIGSLQWHEDRDPRIVLNNSTLDCPPISVGEMVDCLREFMARGIISSEKPSGTRADFGKDRPFGADRVTMTIKANPK